MEKLKQFLVVLILGGGFAGYYFLVEQTQLVRVSVLVFSVVAAVAIAYQTEQGRQLWGFLKAARVEVRKVVWPTRKETTQMTMVVILMVIAVGILLWLFDLALGYSVSYLIGTGG